MTTMQPLPLWMDLPVELAGLILCRLLSPTDRLRFIAVCRQWRLAAKQQHPLPSALPWLRLNYDTFQSLPDGQLRHYCMSLGFFSPVCISDGWLLCPRSSSGPDDELFMTNPFSKDTIKLLVPDNCVSSLGGFRAMSQLHKMIVCQGDLIAAIFFGGYVCFYRPGAPSWQVCPHDLRGEWYEDIAFHHGKVYALTTKEDLFAFEAGDSEAAEVSRASHVEHTIRAVHQLQPPTANLEKLLAKRYLFTSSAKLLMVELIDHGVPFQRILGPRIIEKIEVKVFEEELTTGQWVQLKKLDDGQALFVSRGCSKAIPLSGHDPGFQGNRVYFMVLFLWIDYRTIGSGDFSST
ncbi:hypothetical protein GQ55_4G200900 [Panicum hallii var. hallii]|uniref:Uncharacterized protein n=1 Tax=Panicum hallii var. hallii TaxID=1504633 RepID=A0A2T7DZ50_9POAL|nr:hypothetical protein GQ55_4G200900 [Panicum hallii var. hallii]